jgi:hypothetical protein
MATLLEALRSDGSQLCEAAADALEEAADEIKRLNAETIGLRRRADELLRQVQIFNPLAR